MFYRIGQSLHHSMAASADCIFGIITTWCYRRVFEFDNGQGQLAKSLQCRLLHHMLSEGSFFLSMLYHEPGLIGMDGRDHFIVDSPHPLGQLFGADSLFAVGP